MKHPLTCFFFFVVFVFADLSSGAQTQTGQSHLQLSDGGIPWSFKFSQYDSEITYTAMPLVDTATLLEEDATQEASGSKVLRFGYDHYVSFNLNNSGVWHSLENGDKIWRLGIASSGASTINLSFKSMNLPAGCRLFVYNSAKTEFHGAFTQTHVTASDKMLGTELLSGEKVVVELYVPHNALNDVYLEIWRVTHAYKDLRHAVTRSFGAAGSCENNARCPAYAAWDNQIRSGICLVNGGEFCSAALINNTCNDGTPYVLTANHCGSSGFGSWVFRFNWEASSCATPGSSPSSNSISGGTQKAFSAGSDFDLLQMNSTPPLSYNVYYAGWDRTNTPPANPFGIHHPGGDIKKFSQSTGTGAGSTYSGATVWQTPTWTYGVTEPGSSGSPLFNSSGLVVGQLYGGPSDCSCEGDGSCGYDFYGKFFTSWTGGGTPLTRLSDWLEGGCPTGATVLYGYDPNVPAIVLDAGISKINIPANGISTCETTFTPEVILWNYGSVTLTSCTINYQLDAASPLVFSWTGSLVSGASINIALPNFTVTTSMHTYAVYTSDPNAGVDGNTVNDTLVSNFTVISAPTGLTLPFSEGFETITFVPAGWTLVNPDTNATWVQNTTVGSYNTSTSSAAFDNFSPATSIVGQSDFLVTPALDFTGSGTLNLTFDVAYARYDATYADSLIVSITTDCGGSWGRIFADGSSGLATAPDLATAFIPAAAQWSTKTINLDSYIGLNSVQLRFESKSGWGNNLYLDNINLAFVTGAPPVTDFAGSATTVCAGDSLVFTNSTSGATVYSWFFGGGAPATSTATNPTVFYNVPGTYDVTLVANGPGGSDTEVKTGYVVVDGVPPVPTVTNSSGTLAATPATGYTYQWYLNGLPIGGATTSTYMVASDGDYTVEITNAFLCSSTSAVTTVTGMDVHEINNGFMRIYPNPTHGIFTVMLNTGLNEDCDFTIHNMIGQIVFSKPLQFATGARIFDINVSGLAPGIYNLSLTDGTKKYNKKLVVE